MFETGLEIFDAEAESYPKAWYSKVTALHSRIKEVSEYSSEEMAMRDHRPTLTNDLLESQQLSKIQEHAKQINELNKLLKSLLPASLLEHCRAANIKDNHLVIEVASASVQMKLNYDRLHLLTQLRQQGYAKLMGVQIRINPSLYRGQDMSDPDPEWQEVPVSEVAAEFLIATANMPNATPKVKQRLENIANLAKKKK